MKSAPVMKTTPLLAMAVFAFLSISLASSSLIAQQPEPTPPQAPTPQAPSAQSTPAPATSPGSAATANSDAANSTAAPVEMTPVNGELAGKLDTKSAKAGDPVIVKTSDAVQTADGTMIPKGSKLMGHVAKVQSHSQGSENSALGIVFDHAELKGGQSVAIESVIKSVAPATGDMAPNAPDPMASPTSGAAAAPAGGGMAGNRGSGTTTSNPGANTNANTNAVTQGTTTKGANGSSSGGAANAGTVVGKLGNDPIRTTAIPGVFLASMTSSEAPTISGMLFAARNEVHLDGGTQVGLEVATAAAH
jgi:hypothetical protein